MASELGLALLQSLSDRPTELQSPAPALGRRRKPVRRTVVDRSEIAQRDDRQVTASGERAYRVLQPTDSIVLNAFLRELKDTPGATVVARFTTLECTRNEMWLLDQSRLLLPKMLAMLGKSEASLLLFSEFQPSPDATDPHLYIHATRDLTTQLGRIARDYDRAVASRNPKFVACVTAAFAGQLIALAARILGPHVYEDLIKQALRDERLAYETSHSSSSSNGSRTSRHRPLTKGRQ